jgi:hypothetical protein
MERESEEEEESKNIRKKETGESEIQTDGERERTIK